MRRILLAFLCVVLGAWTPVQRTTTFSQEYVGPIDRIAGLDYVLGYDYARKLSGNYFGYAFQVYSPSESVSHNIGYTYQGVANVEEMKRFWVQYPDCAISALYDQTPDHSNMTQATASNMMPCMLTPATDLPQFYADGTQKALYNGGLASSSLRTYALLGATSKTSWIKGNNMISNQCTLMGPGELSGPIANGGLFGSLFYTLQDYGVNCTSTNLEAIGTALYFCVDPDEDTITQETFVADNCAAYGLNMQDMFGNLNFTGSGNSLKISLNGSLLTTTNPNPALSTGGNGGLEIGGGGDGNKPPGIFSEFFMTTKSDSVSEDATVLANMEHFYGAPPYQRCRDNIMGIGGQSVIVAGWSMRLVNTAYPYFSMTILRASDSTTLTIGFDNCYIDSARAAAFCASTTCTVVKLFTQGWNLATFAGDLFPNAPGGGTVTNAYAPTLMLNCNAGRACLHFAGSGSEFNLCNGGLAGNTASVSPPYTVVAVARRTGDDTDYQQIFSTSSYGGLVGFDDAANTALGQATGGYPLTGTAADNAWHVLILIVTSGHAQLYIDGTAAGGGSSSTPNLTGHFCVGAEAYAEDNWLTGDVEEVLLYSGDLTSLVGAITADERAAFNF